MVRFGTALIVALVLAAAPLGAQTGRPDGERGQGYMGPGMMGEMGPGMMGRGAMGPGMMLYQRECARCHGTGGKGEGPDAAQFTPPPADLTTASFWKGTDDEEIARSIRDGYGKMPAFPNLSAGQIDALVAYLHSAFQPK